MYLSHLTLTQSAIHSRGVQAALSRGAYGHHQLLCRIFDATRSDQFQFRHLDDEKGMSFFTLSREEPVDDGSRFWASNAKPFRPVLTSGQQLVFSVRINPTINRSGGPRSPDGKRKTRKRRDLVYETVQAYRKEHRLTPDRSEVAQRVGEQWLDERLRSAGFEIRTKSNHSGRGDLAVSCTGYRQNRVRKGKHEITISTLDCQGVGTVTDPIAFGSLIENGLGSAKGFGCGLVLIKPA